MLRNASGFSLSRLCPRSGAMRITHKPATLIRIAGLIACLTAFASAQSPTAPPDLPPAVPISPPGEPAPRDDSPSVPQASATGPRDANLAPGNPAQVRGNFAATGDTPGTGGANTTAAAVNSPPTAESASAGGAETNYLARFLGIQDSPIKVYDIATSAASAILRRT
jgi:hypothetical protein